MQRLLEAFWPDVLRGEFNADDNEEHALEQIRRRRTEEFKECAGAFKNLDWTRVLAVQRFDPETMAKFPLEQDFFEGAMTLDEAVPGGDDSWSPLFDPKAYQEEHKDLAVDDHRLADDDLRQWGVRVTKIREAITAKAREHALPDDEAKAAGKREKLAGLGLSTRKNHPAGLITMEC